MPVRRGEDSRIARQTASGILRAVPCAILLLAFSSPARSEAAPRSVMIVVLDREMSVKDFDDPAWGQAPSAGQPVQQEPLEGKPPTLPTDCRVIATPSALLIRFVMEEPATEIVARELRRDADLSADDRINFILDTYHDRRNAYYFATNPNGVRVDGLITEEQRNTEDGRPSLDWDTVWDLRVRRTSTGWDALFRIPYASLNFPGEMNGVWGFNFARNIRRRTETDRWSGWRRPYTLAKVSLAGDLQGLPALSARRLRQLAPYAAGAVDHRTDPSDTDLLGKAGLDFRYGVSSAVEAGLTVNTDFAETEADPQQFNFGRTSLFFPEKRSFFLQRSQIFAFGTQSTTLPFFSRTIGLKTDVNTDVSVPIPIDAGLKLSGKLGMTDFGVLGVQTRAASDEPRTDFFAGRFKEDLGHASYVGGLFTDIQRHTSDPLRKSSRTYGFDTSISLTPEWIVGGFYSKTENPGVSGETSAWNGTLAYHGEYADGRIERSNIGSNFDPQMGFVSQNGIHANVVDFTLIPRPQVLGLKDLNFETFYSFRYNENGSLNEREYLYIFRAEWQNGAYSDDDIVDVFDENLTSPLQLTNTVTIPVGVYHFVRHQIALGTDPSRTFAFQANCNFGDYYGGTRNSYTGRIFLKPNPHFSLSVIENYNVVRLPQGNFNLSLFSTRFDWNPTVNLLSSVLLQSDNVDHLTDAQAIVRWLIDPATDVFFVFDQQIGRGFDRPGTRLTLKLRKIFDL